MPNLPVYLLGTGANGVNHHLAIIKGLIEGPKKVSSYRFVWI